MEFARTWDYVYQSGTTPENTNVSVDQALQEIIVKQVNTEQQLDFNLTKLNLVYSNNH